MYYNDIVLTKFRKSFITSFSVWPTQLENYFEARYVVRNSLCGRCTKSARRDRWYLGVKFEREERREREARSLGSGRDPRFDRCWPLI